jgi:hypothetical protein
MLARTFRQASRVVSAWLCVSCYGCARGDIVLGTAAAETAQAAETAHDAMDAASDTSEVAPNEPPAANSVTQQPTASGTGQQPATPPPLTEASDDAGAPVSVAQTSPGCSRAPVQPDVRVDGQPVRFLLDLPATYDARQAYPLVLAFRGTQSSSAEFRTRLGLQAIADAVIVYPDPLDRDTPWQFQRDMALVDELVTQLSAAYCIDGDRVFALGSDAGALFANLVGCVRAEQVRGIATLTSAPPPPGPCFGNTAVWLLQRTDLDPNTVGSGLGNRDFWATRNTCDLLTPEPVAPDPCVTYSRCSPGLPVHFCEYEGAQWPDFAIKGAWQFFESL